MKIIRRLILALLLSITVCQNAWSQTMVEDFGDIYIFTPEDANKVLKKDFVFTNNTIGTIRVDSIKKSCGCTNVKSDKDIISPGESAHFLMEVDLSKKHISGDHGLIEKAIVKFRGISGNSILGLEMRANIEMGGLPRKINLGKLKDENFKVRRFIDISPPVKGQFSIISTSCSIPIVNVSYKKIFLSRYYRIHFEFEMESMEAGTNIFKLGMKYLLDGEERNQTALVQFEKVPKVRHPSSISMGVVNIKEKLMSRQFELLPGYEGIKFSIRGVKTEPKKYLLCDCSEIEEKNAALCIVRFAIPSNAIAGTVSRGNIRIEFFKDISPIDIPVFALFLESDKKASN